MTSATSNYCNQEKFCHAVKGSGYFMGGCGIALTLATIVATVAAIAIGLFAWDGLFVYSVGMRAPLQLLWAIPVTLGFFAIDLFIILNIARLASVASSQLSQCITHCKNKMSEHFSRIC